MKPTPASISHQDDEAIEANAAVWFSLRDRGMSEAETAEFMRWLQQDPRHASVFAELDQVWQTFDQLEAPAGETKTEAIRLAPRTRLGRRGWLAAVLATAAAVTVGFLALSQPFGRSAATPLGGLQTMNLPDGSVLKLNTDSAVEVRFTADERRVELVRGEVFFTVAKNPQRPFVVHAGQVAVRAVGTAFDVRMRPQAIEVLVSEGKVQVNDTVSGASLLAIEPTETGAVPAGGPLLVAGKRAIIPVKMAARAPAEVEAVEPETIARALAWQQRQLQFATATLAEMTVEFNRYNRHQLVIADARLAELQLGGTFPAGDYEVFVQQLEANFGVAAERRENETILRFAR